MTPDRFVPLVLACVLLPSFVQGGFPDEPLPSIQKAVIDSYGKVNHLSVSCLVYVKDIHAPAQLSFGSIEYHFDRRTKQLAIGAQGVPGLLVKDNQLFLLLWHDNNEEVPTYLEIRKATAITWKDVDDARQLIRKECPLADGSHCIPCFVWPFLDGGAERLFSPNARVLKKDGVKEAEVIVKQTDPFAAIFGWGHPDFKHVLIPKEQNPDKIDPNQNPVCIKTEDGTSSWAYAFERETGTLSAAIGVVDRKQVLGVPGNKLLILMKKIASFTEGERCDGESEPVPFQLPQNARRVDAVGLKAAYYTAMAERSQPLREQKEKVEKELQATVEKESQLKARISDLTSNAQTRQTELDNLRQELDGIQGDKVMYSYLTTELQALLDELRRKEGK